MDQNNYFIAQERIILKKWGSIIETRYKILNVGVVKILCLYAEWLTLRRQQSQQQILSGSGDSEPDDLVKELDRLAKLIKENTPRKRIVSKWFNPITCKIEYELEDGLIVQDITSYDVEMYDLYQVILPKEFLCNIYPELIRDSTINSILKDGEVK